MEITDIILVTENYKGTEKNMLMNFTEYMIQFGMQTGKTPSLAAFHTLDLERSKDDRGMWTEVYFSANKSVNARYCVDMEQLCYFLSGRYNDKNAEYYLDEERCSKECFELLDELGINKDGSYREGPEFERDYAVEVREILSRVENVKAASLGEAIDKVMEMYHDEEIVLDSGDFQEVTIEQERKERGR